MTAKIKRLGMKKSAIELQLGSEARIKLALLTGSGSMRSKMSFDGLLVSVSKMISSTSRTK
eukprot:CAMPEP_0197623610 /NCGR_PEP_ID=MMETSP1338-20131121/3596_1 /TAXON_ID=43686 ORGANISM="Pelagodinium beii, Strain RCC1491" /NCGR_SAMPLE_ID=MMETSP1338 /ASSEMBLY_ACC=CAM_ASM_000754 /LENGTH=60 /DNA_ID=CAMNT_0043193639 /DNA_START=330 /DNA_END=509 /DNA_ORIENTATION=+